MDFVKEGKLEVEQKRKQAEWERVRKEDDPIEAPAEVFDNRTLYDKLKEQHEIKKAEYEDTHAIKNCVKGLDSDEYQFLNEIEKSKRLREKELQLEEKKEIDEVKKALISSQKVEANKQAQSQTNKTINLSGHKRENKQAELLSHAVKRKHDTITASGDKSPGKGKPAMATQPKKTQIVVGILPGIGDYGSGSSSESEESSDDEANASINDVDIKSVLFNKVTKTKK